MNLLELQKISEGSSKANIVSNMDFLGPTAVSFKE